MRARRDIGHWIVKSSLALVLLGGFVLNNVSHAQTSGAPTIGGTPPPSVAAGQAYNFTPTVTVPEGQSYSFSISNQPAWASFDHANGRLEGTPAAADIGTYTGIRIALTSGQSFVAMPEFSIEVVPGNASPSIGGAPPGSVTVGKTYSFMPTASDPEGQPLTFSIANKPAWANFSSTTGRLWGSPGSGRIGTYSNVVITVSDGQASASLPPFAIVVLAANSPPTISGVPSASITVGESYAFTPTASDPEGQPLTFSIANKPAWASFSASTGRLSGSPGSARVGTYSNIAITVSDGQASVALGPFSIEVLAANTPPTLDGTPTDWVTAGRSYSFTPTAYDPDGQPLTFSIVNRPAWASFDSANGSLAGVPTLAHAGTYSGIVISVSDGQAGASLGPFAITVESNGRPVIAGTPPGLATVGKAYAFRPTASDPEGATLTFSIVNKPAWAGFASSTGRLYGTPGSGRVGTYSGIRISVSDGQSTVSLPEFSIRVAAAGATGSATVSWSPPATYVDGTPLSDLAGYLIVYGVSPSDLSSTVAIPSPLITSAAIEALAPGTWYFAVKAYTTASVSSDLSAIGFKIIN